MILKINSPKYGIKEVLYDEEDHELIMQYHWFVHFDKGRNFYAMTSIRHPVTNRFTKILMHRLIMAAKPEVYIDHINHDGLYNCRSNLRKCSKSENGMNRRPTKGSSSNFKGVSFNKKAIKFVAYIRIRGRRIHLGSFKTETEAALAYNKAAVEHFGEFALLNEIEQ